MFDFKAELEKLKSGIPCELIKPFTIDENKHVNEKLSDLTRKIENMSLQTEEIYEIIEKNSPDNILLKTLMNICDLLEIYLSASDSDGAGKRKLYELLGEGNITVLGISGERLNPEIHRAISAEFVEGVIPEQILQVIQPGYSYENKIIRKAKVVISK
jgi:molecular chaperone GrpE (heat shock protein)